MGSFKRLSVVLAGFVLLVGACDDGGSTGPTGTSDDTNDTGSTDEGGMCEGSSTVADCATYCAGVLAAACPGGPATPEECEQGCEMLNGIVSQCPAWGTLVECAQTAPQFTCFMGETVPEGCEGEFYCLSLCLD